MKGHFLIAALKMSEEGSRLQHPATRLEPQDLCDTFHPKIEGILSEASLVGRIVLPTPRILPRRRSAPRELLRSHVHTILGLKLV